MARYIDADKYLDELDKQICSDCFDDGHCCSCGVGCARAIAKETPTADVAPRAEVVNKICCEIEEEIVAALESNYRALKEWDDGRCNDYVLEIVNRIKGKIDALRGIEGFVEELKKKYTDVSESPKGE